jgi:DNA recombination-dependent growth factor C
MYDDEGELIDSLGPISLEERIEAEERFQLRQLAFADQLRRQADDIEQYARERLDTIEQVRAALYGEPASLDDLVVEYRFGVAPV